MAKFIYNDIITKMVHQWYNNAKYIYIFKEIFHQLTSGNTAKYTITGYNWNSANISTLLINGFLVGQWQQSCIIVGISHQY